MNRTFNIGLAAVVCLTLVRGSFAEQFTDDFADGILNPCWKPNGECSVTETNGQLVLDKTVGSGVAIDSSVHPLVGDFDVQVDYQLTSFSQPTNGFKFAGLSVMFVADGSTAAAIERLNQPSQVRYKAYTTTQVDPLYADTTDTAGKFRIARSGTVLSMFYWNGSWVQLKTATVTAADLYVNLYAQPGGGDTGLVTVAFDNFNLTDQYRQISISYASVDIDWLSQTDVNYQVQWTTSLTQPAWSNLGYAVVGTGSGMYVNDVIRGLPQRFYRVLENP